MMSYKQLSLADIFTDCQDKFDNDKFPDASKFTRFKQDFLPDLQLMFDRLVDLTESICQNIYLSP